MASKESQVPSTLLTFPHSDLRSASPSEPAASRPLSDRFILGMAFAIGIFICFASAVANAFLLSAGVPAAKLLMKVNAAGGVVAILLIWKLLRWSRERNSLIRQRDRERKLAYEQITKLNQELEQALQRSEKLAVTGLLATTIAHEINNPLEAITNSLYLLENNSRLDETSKSVVALLQREVSRIVDIARQTLGQQRESRLPIRINLSQLLDETCAVFAARMDKLGIRVIRAYQCSGEVTVHSGDMRQVFMNLVANAIDAMPNGGELKLDILRVGPTVRFSIADTGCGIDEADMRHIYDPLFSTKGDKGTGIGLWLTKSIVERFQGSIEVSSSTKQGQNGTSFTIVLPAAAFAEDDSSRVHGDASEQA
jgi:signal transduction histidine kinase